MLIGVAGQVVLPLETEVWMRCEQELRVDQEGAVLTAKQISCSAKSPNAKYIHTELRRKIIRRLDPVEPVLASPGKHRRRKLKIGGEVQAIHTQDKPLVQHPFRRHEHAIERRCVEAIEHLHIAVEGLCYLG